MSNKQITESSDAELYADDMTCTPLDALQATGDSAVAARRSTVAEGLYSGLVSSPFAAAHDLQNQMEAKLKLLVEAPAAVEDALASLVNHVDSKVQVSLHDD